MFSQLMSDRDLLGRLVAFDSVSAKPSAPLADFLADYLQAAGCDVTRYPYDDGQKVNLIARKGPDVEGGLLLSAHLDVVPADEAGWTCEPFQLTERNNRYIGRAHRPGADRRALRRAHFELFALSRGIRGHLARWSNPSAGAQGRPESLPRLRTEDD